MNWLTNSYDTLVAAWMYFTRLPLPKVLTKNVNHSQHSLEQSVRFLPLVGILIGLIGGLVFLGASYVFDNQALAVILSMTATIVATGAFHEDGLGDFFDAFGGGWWDKEKILEIMKDSRMGVFGVLAIGLMLLLKFNALTAISPTIMLAVLVSAHAFSRFVAGSFFFTNQYVRANDKSFFKPMARGVMSVRELCVLAALGTLPLLLLGSLWFLLLVPALWIVRQLFGRWFVRKLGGYTGDCLGTTQQVVEVCFYLGVVVVSRFV